VAGLSRLIGRQILESTPRWQAQSSVHDGGTCTGPLFLVTIFVEPLFWISDRTSPIRCRCQGMGLMSTYGYISKNSWRGGWYRETGIWLWRAM